MRVYSPVPWTIVKGVCTAREMQFSGIFELSLIRLNRMSDLHFDSIAHLHPRLTS